MYSEQQMKEFFQNIVDQVATLSTQAEKVNGLEQRIMNMSDKLRELEQKNGELSQQLNIASDRLTETERKLEQSFRDFDNERAVTNNLREVLIGRDAKVSELEQNNQVEREAHRVTLSERDDARRRGEELDQQVNSFRDSYNNANDRAHQWEQKAHELETEVNDLKSKLDRVSSILNPTQAVSRDFQVVG